MKDVFDRVETFQKAERDILQSYKSVFLDDRGKIVLQDMLYDLYFLREATTPEQQALCNYAKVLLDKIYGDRFASESGFSRLEQIFRKLLRVKK